MIKNIIFDLGGVIIDLDRRSCLHAFENLLGFSDFGEYLNAFAQKGFFARFENGDITAKQFREEVRRHSNKQGFPDEAVDEALNAFLSGIKPEKIELLLELKKEYKLYLLSNNNPIGWKRSREMFLEVAGIPIEEVFDKLYCSFQMHVSKPGREIFQQVLQDAGIKAEESLFVDDAPANIETAKEMHFKTLLYDVSKSLPEEVKGALQHG